jgi:hypothetical protein
VWTLIGAEKSAHCFHVTPILRLTLGSGTAKCEYRVEGLFAIGAFEQVLLEDSMDYAWKQCQYSAVVAWELVLLAHEISHELHPALARDPVAQLRSCGREFYEKRKEAVEGGRSFYVSHPSSPPLWLVHCACQVVPVLGECAVGKREIARGIKWTSKGRGMSRAGPILAAPPVLCPKLAE